MASLGMSLPVDCFKHGPTRPDHKPLPFASLLPGDPALALEQLDVPLDSGIADLPAWIDNFFKAKTPDDDYAQFYVEVYAAIKPNRARVPPEYLEEFKTRAGASPAIWQIEEARACAPEACDVVPPAPAPSPPPPGSQPEPGDSTAEVRVRRRRTLTLILTLTHDPLTLTPDPNPQPGDRRPRRSARPARLAAALAAALAERQRLRGGGPARGGGRQRWSGVEAGAQEVRPEARC